MAKLCFKRHKILEALIKCAFLLPAGQLKSYILKALYVSFGKFIAFWYSSLFDGLIRLPHVSAPHPQRKVLIVS